MQFLIKITQKILLNVFLFCTFYILLFFTRVLIMFSFNNKYKYQAPDPKAESYWEKVPADSVSEKPDFEEQS